MTDVIMPQMGESIAEGTITKWFKNIGDQVERDEPLLEISTDKVDTEIPAPASGVLSEIKVQEGETVPINTVIAVIGGDVKEPTPPTSETETTQPMMPPATASPPETPSPQREPAAPPAPPAPPAEPQTPPSASEAPTPKSESGVRSSPLVRKIAREHDIDLSQLSGSGRGGRVTKEDILKVVEAPGETPKAPEPRPAAPAQPAPSRAEAPTPPPKVEPAPTPAAPTAPTPSRGSRDVVEPMSTMRKSVAEHMMISRQTSAHVTTVFEVDVTRIVDLRAEYKSAFEQDGVKLTYTPFFVRATIASLKTFPIFNASIEGESIVYHKDHNIGVAVALEGGLIVPVIHHADEKSFLGLARAVNDLGERARTKKLLPEEVQGGTFTITNPGPFGGLFGTPIINQPQVAILAVGGIHKRPVVVGDGIGVRSMVYLALSFDHRLIDGALADRFMADLKERLETWDEKIL